MRETIREAVAGAAAGAVREAPEEVLTEKAKAGAVAGAANETAGEAPVPAAREWNEGQLQGITASGANILVSASAGTGKTAVLVERLIRRLTDPEKPLGMDRFILVTFTNAAAGEMLRRVRAGLEELAYRNPGNRNLKRQQLLLGQAAISTLHGFCLDLIRRYYQELGLDPQSRVLGEPEQILLTGEVLEAYLEECYEAGEPGFAALRAAYGGEKTDAPLKELILRVYRFAAARPRPLIWLADCVSVYRRPAEGVEGLLPFLRQRAAESLKELAEGLEKGIARSEALPALAKYAACLEEDRRKITDLLRIEDWDELTAAMEGAAGLFGRLPPVRTAAGKDEAPAAYELRLRLQPKIKEIRNTCKKDFLKLAAALAGAGRRQIREEIEQTAPAIIALAETAAGFYRRYGEVKGEKSVLDFSDIEQYAMELLLDEAGEVTELARTLRRRYDEVLVDEYQDINPVQEALLQALRGKSLFMVGDIKQSIYGFRQAAPRLFLEKFRRYKNGGDGLLILLEESYRGSQWITEGINQVFDYCMTEESCGIDYRREGRFTAALPLPEEARPGPGAGQEGGTQGEEIRTDEIRTDEIRTDEIRTDETRAERKLARREQTEGVLELHVIDVSGEAEREDASAPDDGGGIREARRRDSGETADAREQASGDEPEPEDGPEVFGKEDETPPEPETLRAEALFCAQRIEELVIGKLWDRRKKQKRPAEYRDIVILLPAMKGVADTFVQTLRRRNIPVYADMGGGYFQAQEVQTALSFLKVLDNPRQDIPLAALMLSPAFGFSPEELGKIRTHRREVGGGKGFYEALVYAASKEKTLEIKGLRDFLKKLKEYRLYARQASAADVLLRFFEDTGFFTIASAMEGGPQRRANLLALVQRAREFEEANLQGLYQFLQYLAALEKNGTDLAPAPVAGEGENVVRIMSIHKSKGLEFPIVLLANAGRRFMLKESQNDLLLHESLGMAGAVIQPWLRVKYPGAYQRLAASGIRRDTAAEQQRLLYVALTRAEQRLLVVTADRRDSRRYRQWREDGDEPGGTGGGPGGSSGALSFMDWLGPGVLSYRGPSFWVSRLWGGRELSEAGNGSETGAAGVGADAGAAGAAGVGVAGSGVAAGVAAEKEEQGYLRRVLLSLPASAAAEEKWAFVGRQLEWQYPWEKAAGLAAKLSVTQARGRLYPEEDPEAAEARWSQGLYQPRLEGPRFLRREAAFTGAERGTLLHRVLARIQPQEAVARIEKAGRERLPEGSAGVAGPAESAEAAEQAKLVEPATGAAAAVYLDELLERLTADRFLTLREKDGIDREPLVRFLLSPLFRRIAAADAKGNCRREASFTMAVPARRLYPGAEAMEDEVIIQGTIDVFFEEEDGLVLADYKSDRTGPGGETELLRRYSGQLRLYAEGLEAFTGKKVKEMLLYSLALGKEILL